ncbi:MAG: hypothetical protein A3G41_05275 [Elusimicrobia bacterium RIFCSPLOWO2_12_FULL_59_9]|nr:MAG: hypothetical protein A3G41_05275 [Elusimicrobia bacterium RIFCSPLOWO2_12_FULL_59_9]
MIQSNRLDECRVCHRKRVRKFLSLGKTALANNFLTREQLKRHEPVYPLEVGYCRGCRYVQLWKPVPPKAMFDRYLYVSSTSSTLSRHLTSVADAVVQKLGLTDGDLVVDIGSNDGCLLRGFKAHGVHVLGVEPARNLVGLARRAGVATYNGYFSLATAKRLRRRYGPAMAVTATNSFLHIPDLDDYLAGLDAWMAPEGVFVIEFHYLADLMKQGAFDTVYHEHVSYYSLHPLIFLFDRFGMEVMDVKRLPVHHGQLRVYVKRKTGSRPVADSVAQLLDAETRLGLGRYATYAVFARNVFHNIRKIQRTLLGLKRSGASIAGYGAPAKGNTLLNVCRIGPDVLDFIADKSRLKQGLFTPGQHIPVVPAEKILQAQPDYLLLLAWNFAEEIMQEQGEYIRRGGKFIVPVPRVRII